jgi:UDP-galactopyranose mutase
MMNFTDIDVPYTRIIEHKHFEFGNQPYTWITHEYPTEYKANTTEPYYPVNDVENNTKYQQYKQLANQEKNIIFGGRLAEYKYYDMHQVIESALNFINNTI